MTPDNRYLQRSAKYPLHQGKVTGVKPLHYEIVGAQETLKHSMSVLLHRVRTGQLALGTPLDDSILSGKPGYRFRTEQVELVLAADEIERLVLRNLTPSEFFHLAARIGVFHEIGGEFYDEETGKALRPRFCDSAEAAQELRSRRPQLLLVEDLDGNLRPHSITTLERAEQFAAEVREKYEIRAEVMDFSGPANAWRADPFDNAIALHYGPEGQMRAYGRFATERDAEEFRPFDGGFGYGAKVQVMSVPATAIF
jgi:hypothetical protein